ncbi:hypothetical protein LCGC14_1418590 [marine sediment metagenome]|uniref:Uncharacterized protein n=1 Tax=marine sediment metagenome TaxID=412755 RepID=A0A0F9JRV9_9ZZZZ
MGYKDYLNQGVYIRFTTDKGVREIIGKLVEYDSPMLFVSSKGRLIPVNKNDILKFREAYGEVKS